MNKKGAEMTIGTIIIIILALVVLVVIIYGFSTGWSNLWDKIANFGGGKVNVQTVVQSCQISCTTSSTYDWCSQKRTVIFSADTATTDKKLSWTCDKLQKNRGTEIGLNSCNLGCTTEEGTCDGTSTLKCDDKINQVNCEGVMGCEWKGSGTSASCSVKTIECSDYVDRANCELVKCTWEATFVV